MKYTSGHAHVTMSFELVIPFSPQENLDETMLNLTVDMKELIKDKYPKIEINETKN